MGILFDTFAKQAILHENKTALIAEDGRYTYSDLHRQARDWAAQLLALGGGRPRVGLLAEDPFHTATISLGIAQIDACCVPTNAQMTPAQMQDGWSACDVNIVVYEPRFANKVKTCKTDTITFINTDELEASLPLTETPNDWAEENDFLITLSSGSTGKPKPIMISQAVKLKRAEQAWDLYNLSADDVTLCASPYFHSMGQRLVYTPLLLGATMVHLATFTPKKWLELVSQHKITYTTSVTSHLYALKDELLKNVDQIGSLKTIVTSSAPIDANFKDELFKAIGCDFHEIYGATEVGVTTNLYPKDAQTKFASVGIPCDDIAVKILNDDAKECPVDEVGEIAVKSPLAFSGYYKRDDLTQAALHDGYFLTGDLGSFDEDGFLSYITRKKDVIISGGINIYPSDIENVISAHENVKEAAVIGVEDDLLGEVIVCICTLHKDEKTEPALHQLTNRELAPFQRPLKYFFVDQLPLTPSGKLSKQALREEYENKNDGWTDALRFMMYGK